MAVGYYVNYTNGNLSINSVMATSDYIPVSANTEYAKYNWNYCAWYDNSKTYISGISPNYEGIVTSPEDAAYIRYSWNMSKTGNWNVIFMPYSDLINLPKNLYGYLNLSNKGYYRYTSSAMSDNDVLETPMNNIRKNSVFKLMAKVSELSELRIGHGETEYESSYLKLTSTNADVVNYYSDAVIDSHVHGLTIADYIEITITCKNTAEADIEITSNGATYKLSDVSWSGASRASNFVKLVDGSLSNVVFSWTCKDVNNDIYIFGDSYLGLSSANRWCYYLVQNGYADNVLINSYGGENSGYNIIAARNIFKDLGVPKIAIWAPGMNDGSDTNGEPSSNWLTRLEMFLSLCAHYGVTPVLCTIPNVPNIDHTYKNNYVRESGYRYIDFASAVGSDNNPHWYTNMLSHDNVHPDDLGALTLYNRAITDVPEIVIK